jgi:hypothetical protein
VNRFGPSAPYKVIAEHLGLTPADVVAQAHRVSGKGMMEFVARGLDCRSAEYRCSPAVGKDRHESDVALSIG